MKGSFLKFKRRLLAIRTVKALLAGVSVGLLAAGIWLLLCKRELLSFDLMTCLPVGGGALLVAGAATFLLLHASDRKLAGRMDRELGLRERVRTMVAFAEDEGEMARLQREDTERVLASLSQKALKAKRLWCFLLLLPIGIASLTVGLLAENMRDRQPPEVIVPFEISEIQIAGIEELIRYVDGSVMEEPYRGQISGALTTLLTELKQATTEPQMQAALASALTEITTATYDASSMTEILNGLWKTGDEHIRLLAKALNTSYWTEPDWGDYAESYSAFRESFESKKEEGDEGAEGAPVPAAEGGTEPSGEDLKNGLILTLESMVRKINSALGVSGIPSADPLYDAVNRMIHGEAENAGGLQLLAECAAELSYDEIRMSMDMVFDGMTQPFYSVISTQKNNTNVGEYVLKKLSVLFAVPIPEFERPDFVKYGEGDTNTDTDSDREDENAPSGGGVGEGATFGSKDLVLDPLTGKYVEYGTLYATYNLLMQEKIDDERYGYTEEQKKAIRKYFALLYSGFKNEEGNES